MARPIRTIGRVDLGQKLARHEPIKLVMALNGWAFRAKHIPGSLAECAPRRIPRQ